MASKTLDSDTHIDVIIPCYNCSDTLHNTVDSVLSQKCLNKLFLVEDCSSDNTRSVVESIAQSAEKVEAHLNATNCGAGFSRNVGLGLSQARFVSFMDADDSWISEHHLEDLCNILLSNEWALLAYTNYYIRDQNGVLSGPSKFITRHKYKDQLRSTLIATPAVLIDRLRSGNFEFSTRRTGQDYELWLRLLQIGDALGIDQKSLIINKQVNSLSKSKFQSLVDIYQIQTEHQDIQIFRALFNTILYALNKSVSILSSMLRY